MILTWEVHAGLSVRNSCKHESSHVTTKYVQDNSDRRANTASARFVRNVRKERIYCVMHTGPCCTNELTYPIDKTRFAEGFPSVLLTLLRASALISALSVV